MSSINTGQHMADKPLAPPTALFSASSYLFSVFLCVSRRRHLCCCVLPPRFSHLPSPAPAYPATSDSRRVMNNDDDSLCSCHCYRPHDEHVDNGEINIVQSHPAMTSSLEHRFPLKGAPRVFPRNSSLKQDAVRLVTHRAKMERAAFPKYHSKAEPNGNGFEY